MNHFEYYRFHRKDPNPEIPFSTAPPSGVTSVFLVIAAVVLFAVVVLW
jgi:hypothetical protein